MILIILLTAFSFYMFWRYNQHRKLRNAEHSRMKRESFMNLISTLQNNEQPDNNKNNYDDKS
jgi:glucan phosphoethanolaminetransferase (alkaline phosphatase superfamily)